MIKAAFYADACFPRSGRAPFLGRRLFYNGRISSLAALLKEMMPEMEKQSELPAANALYYLLSSMRPMDGSTFLTADLSALAANCVVAGGYEGKINLLSWEMLPAAVLLAGTGRTITLPANGSAEIAGVLTHYLPEGGWEQTSEDYEILLGRDPATMVKKGRTEFERIEKAKAGVFCCGWDFLGVQYYAYMREEWIKAGLINRLLQLPRPRRQYTSFYPALFAFHKGNTGNSIRMARHARCAPIVGGLNQDRCLELLFGDRPENAVDVPYEKIYRDPIKNLTPGAWLHTHALPQKQTKLRDFAQVLRFQLPRRKVEEEGTRLGEHEDGIFVAREVTLSELDPQTGFVNATGGTLSRMKLSPIGNNGKYLLKRGDILFSYRGTEASIGRVGYVEEENWESVPARSMYIIRALHGVSSIWLYYALRQDAVREFVKNRAVGATLLTISIEAVRDLPLAEPSEEAMRKCRRLHTHIVDEMEQIARLRTVIDFDLGEMEGYLSEDTEQTEDES